MPDFCSCGAELPPDARFCHKCGKPQGTPVAPEEPLEAPAPAPAAVTPLSLTFHNPVAVRVGLSMASLAALLSWLPFLNLGFVIWWLAAGFFSVSLYRRRTGVALSVRAGVRMGWITGILTFVIVTVLFTLSLIPLALSDGGLSALFQQQLRNMPAGDPGVQQAMRIFESPAGLAAILIFMLLLFFFLITLLCTAGGALGARFAARSDQRF